MALASYETLSWWGKRW